MGSARFSGGPSRNSQWDDVTTDTNPNNEFRFDQYLLIIHSMHEYKNMCPIG